MGVCYNCKKKVGVFSAKTKFFGEQLCGDCSNALGISFGRSNLLNTTESLDSYERNSSSNPQLFLSTLASRKQFYDQYVAAFTPQQSFHTGGTAVNSTPHSAGGLLINEELTIELDSLHGLMRITKQLNGAIRGEVHYHRLDEIRQLNPITFYRFGNPVTCHQLEIALYGSDSIEKYLMIDAADEWKEFFAAHAAAAQS